MKTDKIAFALVIISDHEFPMDRWPRCSLFPFNFWWLCRSWHFSLIGNTVSTVWFFDNVIWSTKRSTHYRRKLWYNTHTHVVIKLIPRLLQTLGIGMLSWHSGPHFPLSNPMNNSLTKMNKLITKKSI